jgi:hypothetical protein
MGLSVRASRCAAPMTPDVAVLQSVITYPHCGVAKTETMPTNACQRALIVC